jgi:hypothetical protein
VIVAVFAVTVNPVAVAIVHDVPVPVIPIELFPNVSVLVFVLEEEKRPQEWVRPESSVAPSVLRVPAVKVIVDVVAVERLSAMVKVCAAPLKIIGGNLFPPEVSVPVAIK